MRRLLPMRGDRSPQLPFPPPRRHKHHASPEEAIRHWNAAISNALYSVVGHGVIVLVMAILAILTAIFFVDNIALRTFIFAVLFLIAIVPLTIFLVNLVFLILFAPGHFFQWREYQNKHGWEAMNRFRRSKTYRRLVQEEAIQEKNERLMEQGAPHHIGPDGEIIFDEKPKHRK